MKKNQTERQILTFSKKKKTLSLAICRLLFRFYHAHRMKGINSQEHHRNCLYKYRHFFFFSINNNTWNEKHQKNSFRIISIFFNHIFRQRICFRQLEMKLIFLSSKQRQHSTKMFKLLPSATDIYCVMRRKIISLWTMILLVQVLNLTPANLSWSITIIEIIEKFSHNVLEHIDFMSFLRYRYLRITTTNKECSRYSLKYNSSSGFGLCLSYHI